MVGRLPGRAPPRGPPRASRRSRGARRAHREADWDLHRSGGAWRQGRRVTRQKPGFCQKPGFFDACRRTRPGQRRVPPVQRAFALVEFFAAPQFFAARCGPAAARCGACSAPVFSSVPACPSGPGSEHTVSEEAPHDSLPRDEHDVTRMQLPVEVLKAMDADPNVALVRDAGSSSVYIKLNMQRPPTDDVHFRRALALAFNYDAALSLLQVTDASRVGASWRAQRRQSDCRSSHLPPRAGRLWTGAGRTNGRWSAARPFPPKHPATWRPGRSGSSPSLIEARSPASLTGPTGYFFRNSRQSRPSTSQSRSKRATTVMS